MTTRVPYTANKKLTVINMFGGPGSGKSTTAAFLFGEMNAAGMNVELVHEAAKGFVWEQQHHIFGEQDWIFAHQHRLIRRLVDHNIDYCVVDSSILLSLFYMPDDFPQSFGPFVRDTFDSYDNINIIVKRNPDFKYKQTGRNENQEQAVAIDRRIEQYFIDNDIPYHIVIAGPTAASLCMSIVRQHPNAYRTV